MASNLPDIPYLTLSDKVHLAGLAFIFLALLESCYVGWLVRRDRVPLAEAIDSKARILMVPGYAITVGALVLLR